MIYAFRPRWFPLFAVATTPGSLGVAFGLTRRAAIQRHRQGRVYQVLDESDFPDRKNVL